MKTNKKCPMYKNNPVNVAPTDQELAEHESNLSQDDLVKVEGTKVGQGNQGGLSLTSSETDGGCVKRLMACMARMYTE